MTDVEAPLQVFKNRTVRGTERHVHFDGRHLVKEYRHVRWLGDTRRPWYREHTALQRLLARHVLVPRSFGYVRGKDGVIRFHREFVPGTHMESIDSAHLNEFSDYLASVHRAGVTTCDLSPGNLLLTLDGKLLFIDYGRARTFRFRTPLFYFYVGKELARCQRRMPFEAPACWNDFYRRYCECAMYPAWASFIIHQSIKWWAFRWKLAPQQGTSGSGSLAQPAFIMSVLSVGLDACDTMLSLL